MRKKERIPVLLNLIDWNKLEESFSLNFSNIEKDETILIQIDDYWNKNPDQRFGQMLINLGIAENNYYLWNEECNQFLKDQGVDPKEYTLWGVNFDKDRNRLPETTWKLAKDLDTDHIEAILEDYSYAMFINKFYATLFKSILEDRE